MHEDYKKLYKFLSIYAIGNIIQNAVNFLLLPYYSLYFSLADFGVYSLITLTVAIITDFITNPAVVAIGRFYYKPDFKNERAVFLYNLLLSVLFQSIIIAVIFIFGSTVITKTIYNNVDYTKYVKIAGWLILLTPLSTLTSYFIRISNMAAFYFRLSIINVVAIVIANIFMISVLHFGIETLLYSAILSSCINIIFCLPVYLKHIKAKLSLQSLEVPFKYAYPQLISGYCLLAINFGNRYILNIYETMAQVGLFWFGYSIASILQIAIITPLGYGIEPIVLSKEGKPVEQKEFIRTLCTQFYFLTIGICLAVSLFAKDLIIVIARKPEFRDASIFIPVFALAFSQLALGNFTHYGMIMKNKSFHISGILITSTIFAVASNFILVPFFGLMGAAVSSLLTYTLWNILKMYYSAKFYQLYFNIKKLLLITFVAISIYIIAICLPTSGFYAINFAVKISFLFIFVLLLFKYVFNQSSIFKVGKSLMQIFIK